MVATCQEQYCPNQPRSKPQWTIRKCERIYVTPISTKEKKNIWIAQSYQASSNPEVLTDYALTSFVMPSKLGEFYCMYIITN